ncbi:unnamed protein product [Candida verbasci]|uniref:Zn(2)-C6 fungal-type domain-containing protein n=1 Tax=Candida verbasci TaxID=1227364 RepID=A0A9W4TTP7_9ASCO|nr:unnamed protein product [Candida verbasci]
MNEKSKQRKSIRKHSNQSLFKRRSVLNLSGKINENTTKTQLNQEISKSEVINSLESKDRILNSTLVETVQHDSGTKLNIVKKLPMRRKRALSIDALTSTKSEDDMSDDNDDEDNDIRNSKDTDNNEPKGRPMEPKLISINEITTIKDQNHDKVNNLDNNKKPRGGPRKTIPTIEDKTVEDQSSNNQNEQNNYNKKSWGRPSNTKPKPAPTNDETEDENSNYEDTPDNTNIKQRLRGCPKKSEKILSQAGSPNERELIANGLQEGSNKSNDEGEKPIGLLRKSAPITEDKIIGDQNLDKLDTLKDKVYNKKPRGRPKKLQPTDIEKRMIKENRFGLIVLNNADAYDKKQRGRPKKPKPVLPQVVSKSPEPPKLHNIKIEKVVEKVVEETEDDEGFEEGDDAEGKRYGLKFKRKSILPRSKNGCWICRIKHLKCDEMKPECNNCLKFGLECDYSPTKPDYVTNKALRVEKIAEYSRFRKEYQSLKKRHKKSK